MNDGNSIWPFVLSALAVWRLTHLVAEEDGPWDLIVRLRAGLGTGMLGRLFDCFYCLSLWFALPFAVWIASGWLLRSVNWLALSGAACLLEKISSRQSFSFPPDFLRGETPCAVDKSEAP